MENHLLDNHAEDIKKSRAIFEPSDSDASVGHESSESDGPSGDDEVESEGEQDNTNDESPTKSNSGRKFKIKYDKLITNNVASQTLLQVCNLWRENDDPGFYRRAYKWTEHFRSINYSTSALFENFLKLENMTYCVLTACTQYMPVTEKSPKFGVQCKQKYDAETEKCYGPIEWEQLNLFQGINDKKTPVIFCGGPIRAIEWVPFPETYDGNEYAAISCQIEIGHAPIYGEKNMKKCLIQIWKFGKFDTTEPPKYEYSLAFDYGPVFAMKFCPSGGYIPEKRLGILAIASMAGNIYLYSLPCRLSNDCATSTRIVLLSPSLNLTFHFDASRDEINGQNKATHLVWTKESGHSIIIAGYGNGMVALWNIVMESSFIRRDSKVLPIHIFYPFSLPITVLDVQAACHTRYLVVAAEKIIKMYDLKTYAHPTLMIDYKVGTDIMSGVWPLHWSGFVVGRDEGSFLGMFHKHL